jgi:predicted pyridoxine 5'-phosphate oxidase superfamily flavin-nucleotide-binding protein
MPDQHRAFYQQQPMLFVAHTDKDGWPWGSVLSAPAGFIQAKKKSVRIQAIPVKGDPLNTALESFIRDSSDESSDISEGLPRLGFLGLDMSTRRRNRFSAELTSADKDGFNLNILSAFGNCPKFIQRRKINSSPAKKKRPITAQTFSHFDQKLSQLISTSDTFFVASTSEIPEKQHDRASYQGADISHRGGKPGFVRVDNNKCLTIPDYQGNFYFNTLGNLWINPRAGLLFIDFDTGDVYSMTGRTEIFWHSKDEQEFEGAERLWSFHLEKGIRLENAFPL